MEWQEDKESGKGQERREYRIGFLNVAGMENKDKDFWEKLKIWDMLFLSETWLQKKVGEGKKVDAKRVCMGSSGSREKE